MKLTAEQIREAVDIHIQGKDTKGVTHHVLFDMSKGIFTERIDAQQEPSESPTSLIEVYNNHEFHGRFNRYGIIDKELQENAHNILDNLYELISMRKSTYRKVRRYENDDLANWLFHHKLSECILYIRPQKRLEYEMSNIAQIVRLRLNKHGYTV